MAHGQSQNGAAIDKVLLAFDFRRVMRVLQVIEPQRIPISVTELEYSARKLLEHVVEKYNARREGDAALLYVDGFCAEVNADGILLTYVVASARAAHKE